MSGSAPQVQLTLPKWVSNSALHRVGVQFSPRSSRMGVRFSSLRPPAQERTKRRTSRAISSRMGVQFSCPIQQPSPRVGVQFSPPACAGATKGRTGRAGCCPPESGCPVPLWGILFSLFLQPSITTPFQTHQDEIYHSSQILSGLISLRYTSNYSKHW